MKNNTCITSMLGSVNICTTSAQPINYTFYLTVCGGAVCWSVLKSFAKPHKKYSLKDSLKGISRILNNMVWFNERYLVNNKVHSFMLMTVAYFAQFFLWQVTTNTIATNRREDSEKKIVMVQVWFRRKTSLLCCVSFELSTVRNQYERWGTVRMRGDWERSAIAKCGLRISCQFSK